MQKTLWLLFLSLASCNYGSSIADQQTKTSASGSGGAPLPASGGASGAALGGATGTASGGVSGTSSIAVGGTTEVKTEQAGTGGAMPLGQGGMTVVAAGGEQGTGGKANGTGGVAPADAGAAGGSAGGTDAGSLPAGTGGTPGTGGARGTGGVPGSGGATGVGGSTTACIPGTSAGQSGMDTGQACLGCHVSGGRMSKLPFTAAGSLYANAAGGTVVSGATVTITGSDNKQVTIVTGKDGNFYTQSAIAFPATVQISKCPDTVAMMATITSGDCNSCHGSSMRVHLP